MLSITLAGCGPSPGDIKILFTLWPPSVTPGSMFTIGLAPKPRDGHIPIDVTLAYPVPNMQPERSAYGLFTADPLHFYSDTPSVDLIITTSPRATNGAYLLDADITIAGMPYHPIHIDPFVCDHSPGEICP